MSKINKVKLRYFSSLLWWKLLLIFVIGLSTTLIVARDRNKYKDDEILDVFITGKLLDSDFDKKLYDSFPDHLQIKQVTSTIVERDNSMYNSFMKSHIGICSDIFVVSNDIMDDVFKTNIYTGFSSEEYLLCQSSFSNLSEYTYNGKFAGYKIYDENDDTYNKRFKFTSNFTFKNTSYLFIDKTSSNINTKYSSTNYSFLAFYNFLSLYI